MDEKKKWFYRVNSRIYIPISWEGWLLGGAMMGAVFLIPHLHGLGLKSEIVWHRDWPVVLEVFAVIGVSYFLAWGRVRR